MRNLYLLISILLLSSVPVQAQLIDVVTGISNPARLFLNGNDLYYSTTSEIFKVDITQSSPTPILVVDGLNGAVGMAIGGNTLYFTEFNLGRISKINITDPTPTVETVIAGLNTPANLFLSGNTMYFSDNNSDIVAKFDVTDPNPIPIIVATSTFNFNPSGLALQGNILYMGQGQANRVSKVDVTSGVTQPTDVVVGVNRPLGIRVIGNNLIIAEYIGNKVSIKDLTDGSNTAVDLVTGVNGPLDIEVAGSTIFILEKGTNKISKVENILGLDQVSLKTIITLYPNPALSVIQISNLETTLTYSIYNLVGAKIMDGTMQPNEIINVETLATGVYIFKTQDGKTMKFVKN